MSRTRRPNQLRFPWELWLESTHPIEVIQGRDFHQTVRGFVTMLKREANRLTRYSRQARFEVEIRSRRSSGRVWFQFRMEGKQ